MRKYILLDYFLFFDFCTPVYILFVVGFIFSKDVKLDPNDIKFLISTTFIGTIIANVNIMLAQSKSNPYKRQYEEFIDEFNKWRKRGDK